MFFVCVMKITHCGENSTIQKYKTQLQKRIKGILTMVDTPCFSAIILDINLITMKTDVTSSKRRPKNSMKCAIAKLLNQDGRPDRYWKLEG